MDKRKLSLSIVIPVFNEEEHLQTCLQSIARQTTLPDEVVVVDNNSTDRSAVVATQYPFVRVIREKQQGIAHARDAGFDAATSDLIGRIDADTVLPETWVEDVYALYQHRRDFAFTGGGTFYNVSAPHFNSYMLSQIAFRINRFIMGHYILWGSNMVLPRSQWRRVRKLVCSTNKDIHEDLDLAIHLHRIGCPITFKENIKVGVEMKRAFSGDTHAFRKNLSLWPETLYTHNLRRAWLGKAGASFLYWGTMIFMKPADRILKTYHAGAKQLRSLFAYDTDA
jgi:glycosyltransferase involved in cell wall biosynthesis